MNGIKFKGYKAFSDDWISIENFPNITVLIGRNNSGKSSCIDVIESLTNPIVYKQCQELVFLSKNFPTMPHIIIISIAAIQTIIA